MNTVLQHQGTHTLCPHKLPYNSVTVLLSVCSLPGCCKVGVAGKAYSQWPFCSRPELAAAIARAAGRGPRVALLIREKHGVSTQSPGPRALVLGTRQAGQHGSDPSSLLHSQTWPRLGGRADQVIAPLLTHVCQPQLCRWSYEGRNRVGEESLLWRPPTCQVPGRLPGAEGARVCSVGH